MKTTDRILARHAITSADYLGSGIEAQVYAISETTVIRILGDKEFSSLDDRSQLCSLIREYDFTFATPEILSIEQVDGVSYTIERRFSGSEMSQFLARADDDATRRTAWRSYIEAAGELSRITLPERPFGELLATPRSTAATWGEYLQNRVLAETQSCPHLSADLPDSGRVVDELLARIGALDEPAKQLVHGDFYPNNIFVDDSGNVSGVGDFSMLTVVGDPLMDYASALYFPQIYDQITTAETERLEQVVSRRFGQEALTSVTTYKLYYSAIFVNEKNSDPLTYRWALAHLKGL